MRTRTIVQAVVVLAAVEAAFAQDVFQVEAGFHGGLLISESIQANRLCSGAGCAFGSRSFETERSPLMIGPAVAVRILDRVKVRFEAVHRSFSYDIRNDVVALPSFESHSVSRTRGHSWEYPLLAAYEFGNGTSRAFAGGGIGLGGSAYYKTDSQFSTTTLSPQGPITSSGTDSRAFTSFPGTAYYVIGGVDARAGRFSIGPELRYIRYPGGTNSSAETIFKPNQFEASIGLSFHLFRVRQ